MTDHSRNRIRDGIEPRRFRDTLGHYASGLTVITAAVDGKPVGFTCQSFYSVSVDPPLISFSVMKGSLTYPIIRQTGRFAVNVLSKHQPNVSDQLSRRGIDRWSGISWTASTSGNPVIDGSLMWLDCEIWAEHEAGDHLIVLGLVKDLGVAESSHHEPLLFFKGSYRWLGESTTDEEG